MAVKVRSATLVGIDAVGVEVEAQIISSLRRFVVVGLPDGVLREARDRVRCALENTGFFFPRGEVIVSLAPASLPKHGAGFDLAIALSILGAAGQIDPGKFRKRIFLGELTLDGKVKPVPGSLAAACYAETLGDVELLLAGEAAQAAALIDGVSVIPVRTLLEAVAFLTGKLMLEPVQPPENMEQKAGEAAPGFGDVVGQYAAKRAMEVAAAGGHNMLMIGPPGAGKTMLARRLLSIVPSMGKEEMLEVTKVYSAFRPENRDVGRRCCPKNGSLISSRPFRAPHHTTSTAGLIGGGPLPLPGEISLAHKGVLFLDEFTELRRDTLEALREPLETKNISISRAKQRLKFPADFLLIAAMNPCPCGKRGSLNPRTSYGGGCDCAPQTLRRYMNRLSGPIVDRLDLRVWVPPVPVRDLGNELLQDPTAEMRARVLASREIQRERFQKEGVVNSQMGSRELKRFCKLDGPSLALLEKAAERFSFSARGYTKVLKVARTIADLEGSEQIGAEHVSEALSYRTSREEGD